MEFESPEPSPKSVEVTCVPCPLFESAPELSGPNKLNTGLLSLPSKSPWSESRPVSEMPITSPNPVRFAPDIVLAKSAPEIMLAFEFWMERTGPGSTLVIL